MTQDKIEVSVSFLSKMQLENEQDDSSMESKIKGDRNRDGKNSDDTDSDSGDDSDDSDDDDIHKELERQDWEPIRAIADVEFKQLLLKWVDPYHTLPPDACRITQRTEGAYHHVVFVKLNKGALQEHYIIKVPAVGTAARWQQGDAHNLRCEADLMLHIRRNTSVPVAEVLAYEDSPENALGAPYILMKQLPGEPANKIWFEEESDDPFVEFMKANCPSKQTEQKRRTFLHSLARLMAELQTLEFDKIGMLNFDLPGPPIITHAFHWTHHTRLNHRNINIDGALFKIGPFNSSKGFVTAKLERMWPSDLDPSFPHGALALGVRKVLDIVFSTPVISSSKKLPTDQFETFVLRHNDLDLQNILADDDGNVTGILDWDGCITAPRCAGYASVPEFLRLDWQPNFDLEKKPHMAWKMDYYRQIYADAMLETDCIDAKYTRKSAMYLAATDVLYDGGSGRDLATKLLLQIPSLRCQDLEQFLEHLGKGWPDADEFLRAEIPKILDPQVPTYCMCG